MSYFEPDDNSNWSWRLGMLVWLTWVVILSLKGGS